MRPFEIPPGQGPSGQRPPGQGLPGQELPGEGLAEEDTSLDLMALRAADRRTARRLRLAGYLCFAVGAAVSTVGAVSVWSHYAHMLDSLESLGTDPRGMTPEYVWCLYVGIPLLAASMVLRLMATVRDVGTRWR